MLHSNREERGAAREAQNNATQQQRISRICSRSGTGGKRDLEVGRLRETDDSKNRLSFYTAHSGGPVCSL
jgi:hypothetical protein